ncbi:phage tail protein [Carnimonas bestiolae]|uniref:phage tail protein n=1 Tax=Carnimonas bestiolae TaxID=3402172 RepID=UPI003EDCA322
MAENSIDVWANGGSANALSNAAYKRLDKSTGFEKGTASSEQANTLWRASSVPAAGLSEFVAEQQGTDVTIDLGKSEYADLIKAALTQFINNGTGVPGSVVPVGSPIPWPKDEAPKGWLLMEGQSTDGFPVLKQLYGDRLPDMRGQFIRGCEQGRAVLSTQDDQIKSHEHDKGSLSTSEAGGHTPSGKTAPAGEHFHKYDRQTSERTEDGGGFDDGYKKRVFNEPAETSVEPAHEHELVMEAVDPHIHPVTGNTGSFGGNETRPRNIAFNYIVRAA